MFTVEELQRLVPKKNRQHITQGVVDTLNDLNNDEDGSFAEAYKENFVTFSSVMQGGDYRIKDYMSAVKYVSYKLMEYSNIDAYMHTFPDRYSRLLEKYSDFGTEDQIREQKISAHVSMYNKNKLVNKVREQAIIPSAVLNVGMYQDALNRQAWLMMNANSEMVQTTAANSILNQLKPAETTKVELDIGLKENDVIGELRKVTQELAQENRRSILSGVMSSKEVIEGTIIEVEQGE